MAGAAIAGSLVSAVVRIAIANLSSAPVQQASLLWNFSKDLEHMKDVLETISTALQDAERRSVKEEMVQLWLKRLKDAALDISDMLEDYEGTSDQAKAQNLGVLSCFPIAYKKTALANRMKNVRDKLTKINKDFENFKFIITQDTSTAVVQHYDKRETASGLFPEVKGREGEKQEIINLIYASTNSDESETRIVPIYGLGGMGKTTLAQLVYNDDQFKKQYDCRIWVYVSQDFNLLKIGNSIISQVSAEGAQQNRDLQNRGLQVIMDCLDNLLCNKKVLIVLDDLWEKDDTELSKLKNMLHVGKKGRMIDVIVTTREEGIARNISTSKLYKLQPLKDDICWEIIKRSSKCNQREFERIGLDIAKKCGGLPLAAQALGYMLQSKDISEWKNINDSDIWNHKKDDRLLPSLWLSYQTMPQQLRICFSYCAIFSKGHNIVEDDLIHQWSVLGFIETSEGKEYIKHLLGMSFLQVSKIPSTCEEHVVRYTMHDLVHDLARLTMADELIVFDVVPPRYTRAHKYCHYSLLRKYDRTMKLANMPSKMRALRFSDSGELLDIPSGAFSFAKCLRTLDFSECSGVLLPTSIGHLKQLRCLIAPRIQNETLPECITELSKLQYLNLNGSPKISVIPESIGKLGCLEYLYLCGCSGISKLPESFGDLKCMVHLDMSGCAGIRELPNSLGNLTNLQNIELSGCSDLKAIPESSCGLTKLQYLNLSSCDSLDQIPESICKLGCLKYLCLSRCAGISKLPESFGDLKCMVHLDMSGCSGLTGLPDSLGNLKHLQHLELSGCSMVKAVPESLCGLTQLLHLNLSSCTCLEGLPEGIGGLVDLQHLDMSGCKQMEELPQSLMKLQSLSHLNLSGCGRMRRGSLACLRGLTALQYLDMSGLMLFGDQFHLPSDVFRNLTSVKYMGLSGCRLQEVNFIGTLTNLEHLNLSFNSVLEFLPESIGNLKRLHTLDLSHCILGSLPESIGTLGLKSLVLDGCPDKLLDQASSLVNYSQTLPVFRVRADDVNGCSNLHLLEGVHVSDLRIRCLENVRFLEEATKIKLSYKHNLSKLTLAWSSIYKRGVQILEDKALLELLVPPTGLKSMCLDGYSSTSFPGWLMCISSHLTNLVSIQLHQMPTCSNLPPLGQLQHLEKLSLFSLPGIKRIDREFCGGKGAFRRLSYFSIRFMKGLEEWNTTYSVEDGVEELMFPVLDYLDIFKCTRLRLKPCPPTFRECHIDGCDQVIFSLDELDKTSHHCPSSSPAIKLHLDIEGNSCQRIRLFHHFPALRELHIKGFYLTSVPESMRCLTSLESLTLAWCPVLSSLPEWLGDLSSLKSLVITKCRSIKSLPRLTQLQKLEISYNQELKKWCESEENKSKLPDIDIQVFEEECYYSEDDYDSENDENDSDSFCTCDEANPEQLQAFNDLCPDVQLENELFEEV